MEDRPPYIQIRPDRLGAGGLRDLLEAEFSLRRAEQRRQFAVYATALAGLPLMVAVQWPLLLGAAGRSVAACAWAALALFSVGLMYDEIMLWRRRNVLLASRPPDPDHGPSR